MCVRACVFMCVRAYVCVYRCVRACAYVCVRVRACVSARARVCVCVCVCVRVRARYLLYKLQTGKSSSDNFL